MNDQLAEDKTNDGIELNPNIHFLVVEDDEVDIMNITRAFKKNNIYLFKATDIWQYIYNSEENKIRTPRRD